MIPLSVPHIVGNEWKYIKDSLDTNWVSSVGSYVDLFEDKFKSLVRAKQAIVTMNGTAAITLALQVLGIGPGDEVIVPSMTFIATVNPVKYVGAEPVFVDITPDTWVMDVSRVEGLITSKTKAIIPVHLYGNVVDMDPLLEIARAHGLFIIEDATEALGSEYKPTEGFWCKAGTIGDFGVFSFNGNKTITTGAGGMLVTDNEEWGKRAKFLSNQSKTALSNGGFMHEEVGFNYRMPNILAAMGVAQLEKLEEYIQIKREHGEQYSCWLKNVKGIQLPTENENVKHSHWLYSILINENYGISRDELIKKLEKNGIQSRPFFSALHRMKPYRETKAGGMTITNLISNNGINLPSSVGLKEEEIEMVCKCIRG